MVKRGRVGSSASDPGSLGRRPAETQPCHTSQETPQRQGNAARPSIRWPKRRPLSLRSWERRPRCPVRVTGFVQDVGDLTCSRLRAYGPDQFFFNGLLRNKLQPIKCTNCKGPIPRLFGKAESGERLHTLVLAGSPTPAACPSAPPSPSPAQSGEHTLLFVSTGLLFLDGSRKWSLRIRGLP